eukprot:6183660-Pleurochrysis_carterae.AAC.1
MVKRPVEIEQILVGNRRFFPTRYRMRTRASRPLCSHVHFRRFASREAWESLSEVDVSRTVDAFDCGKCAENLGTAHTIANSTSMGSPKVDCASSRVERCLYFLKMSLS